MTEAQKEAGCLTTIGYGDRPWENFVSRLRRHQIGFLIDVRSQPRSRQSEFNQEELKVLLSQSCIQYVYMGDALGGMPNDPVCYVEGKIDYARCSTRDEFVAGLDRLCAAEMGGHRIALMCSELDPERCHRSKLIGQALAKRGVELCHIDRDGEELSQHEVIARLTKGQSPLFEDSFLSRGRYERQKAYWES